MDELKLECIYYAFKECYPILFICANTMLDLPVLQCTESLNLLGDIKTNIKIVCFVLFFNFFLFYFTYNNY